MKAFLLLTDTLDFNVCCESLQHVKPGIMPPPVENFKNCMENYCNSGVLITAIICLSLTIIALSFLCHFSYKKKCRKLEKQLSNYEAQGKENDSPQKISDLEYQERKDYRIRLINFLEKRATKKEEKTEKGQTSSVTNEFDDTFSEYYIKELKSLIKELKPIEDLSPTEDKAK